MCIRLLSVLFFFLAHLQTCAATIVFSDDIPSEIEQNSQRMLEQRFNPSINRLTYDNNPEYYNEIISRLTEDAAKPYGYFSMQCKTTELPSQAELKLQVSCQPNQPIRLHTIQVIISGPGQKILQPQWQSTESLLNRGDILDTTRYETVKTQIITLARAHGYIDASTKKSSLLVDVDAKMANVYIHLETGERYQFGPIQFQQSVYSQPFLRSLAPFHHGDIYDKHQLSTYKSILDDSNLFQSISLLPGTAKNHEKAVPIQVVYDPIAKLQYGLSLGYSTSSDFFYSTSIQRNRLSKEGTHFLAEGLTRTNYTTLSGLLSIPNTHPTYDFFNIKLGYQRETISYVGTDRAVTASLSHIQQNNHHADQSHRHELTLNYSIDRSKPDDERTQKFSFLYPSYQQNWRLYFANRAANLSLSSYISANIKALISPTNFMKIDLKQQYFHQLSAQSHAIQLRLRQGYIASSDKSQALPISWYFYTGGAYSVRGFSHNSIGANPDYTDAFNTVMFLASAEYQRCLQNNLYWILFIDSGDAKTHISKSHPSYSVGSGILWKTFAGNLEISIAKPLENDSSNESMKPSININIYQPLQ